MNINQLKEMENFKGTKGKWFITRQHSFESVICSDSFRICEAKSFGFDSEHEDGIIRRDPTLKEQKANALLISKAPEMLEMLAKVLEINKHHDFNGHMINEQIEQLIKSATEL